MDKQTLFQKLEAKDRDLEQIVSKVIDNPEMVDYLISGLSEENARIKYSCSNTLVKISERKTELLYPHFDLFSNHLKAENKFIKWGAIIIIANLTKVDVQKKFDKIFNKYYSGISGPIMITAANITKGSSIIAIAKPYLTEQITQELLKIKNATYQTEECRNVILGHMISSFTKFFNQIENKEQVVKIVKKQLENPRKPTKNKAEKFIKKWKLSI